MSSQIASYSVTPASVADLKRLYEHYSFDRHILWPKLKGMNHKTRCQLIQIQPKTVPALGQVAVYSIYKTGDFMDDLVLELNMSQIAFPGGTFAAYRNDVSGFIREARLYQGGAILQTHTFDEYCFWNSYLSTYEEYQALTEAVGILPLATRIARNAAGPQTFYIPIRCLFDNYSAPLSLLNEEIQLQLEFRPMNQVIQSDSLNPTAQILSANLRGTFLEAGNQLMADMFEQSKIGTLPFGVMDMTYVTDVIPAGIQTHRLLLTTFRSLTPYFAFWVREQRQVVDTTYNPNFEWTNTVAYQSFNMQDRGQNVASNPVDIPSDYVKLHMISTDFHKYFDPSKRFTDYPGLFSYSIEPIVDLHSKQVENMGQFDFSQTQSAYLIINFPAPLAVPCTLSVYGPFINLALISNGAIRKMIV